MPPGEPPEALDLFERLNVGPVRLERRRLIAPYRITRPDGSADAIELIYSWETGVFDPGEPADRNLADMIAAQLALNYGLFCRRMIFHGVYDRPDRSFLRDMAENTAREIYVKKFLEPNPFLVGEAAEIPAVRPRKYCRTRLEFPEAGRARPGWRAWETRRNRHRVLSSGGKDSLVGRGLLREIGMESHPIFVNESGRHWFTALNAYRHFRDSEPRAGRVWVNSDRVFAWMLRRMSFIRPDFVDVRADEYPVRLWTVAVFLFGALPLMRKRGIGRLVVGDEFDTTRRENHRGIPHYDGLYDQSRFFDDAMSRYFLRKGWGVRQFSILRPLSELLVERILAARYPELLAQQVSCHAARKDGDQVRPCGRCEKCRRIVGMLTALGVDPGQCGYAEAQIAAGLAALVDRGTYAQAEAESAQLFHMLAERGAIALPEDRRPAPRPEALALRFDPVVSPPEAVPRDLCRPLFRFFLEHAEGAVRRSGRRWESFEPLADSAADAPYPFEVTSASAQTESGDPAPTDEAEATFRWGELNWPDAAERFRQVDIVLLPVGAVEQHGPHLPLDTDAFDADYLARRVAEARGPPRRWCCRRFPRAFPIITTIFRGR
ncbi:MAG: creatininase family protein [Desulfococcaceae bacterium]